MLQYAYRADGLRAKLAFADGSQTASWSWARSDAGGVQTITDSSGQSAGAISYDAYGRVSSDSSPPAL
jgi:hypothetical protein